MTTSGTYSFSQNRDAIIARAARLVSAIASGETPDANTVKDFSDAMNAMARHWQTEGINIWTTGEGILFPALNQVRYTLGTGSTDHATETFAQTTISATEASGQTILSVTSTTSMTAADQIGVQLDDGTIQWSTIASKSSTTVTVNDALTDSASAGNLVVSYTTPIVRPLKIISARRYNFSSELDTPLMPFDRIEYQELPNKTTPSTINGYFYDRRGGANASGYLYLWPQPSSILDQAIKFTFARPIQDISTAANTADFPDEWFQALAFNLALVMAPEYDLPEGRTARLEKMAGEYLLQASWWERELTEVQFAPARR